LSQFNLCNFYTWLYCWKHLCKAIPILMIIIQIIYDLLIWWILLSKFIWFFDILIAFRLDLGVDFLAIIFNYFNFMIFWVSIHTFKCNAHLQIHLKIVIFYSKMQFHKILIVKVNFMPSISAEKSLLSIQQFSSIIFTS